MVSMALGAVGHASHTLSAFLLRLIRTGTAWHELRPHARPVAENPDLLELALAVELLRGTREPRARA
jgi:hypothetical protein